MAVGQNCVPQGMSLNHHRAICRPSYPVIILCRFHESAAALPLLAAKEGLVFLELNTSVAKPLTLTGHEFYIWLVDFDVDFHD